MVQRGDALGLHVFVNCFFHCFFLKLEEDISGSSGEEYLPDESGLESDDDLSGSEKSDILSDIEERLVSDVFSDKRPKTKPQFTAPYSGINSVLGALIKKQMFFPRKPPEKWENQRTKMVPGYTG